MDIKTGCDLSRKDLFDAALFYFGRLGKAVRMVVATAILLLGFSSLATPGSRCLAWFCIPYAVFIYLIPRINAWVAVRRYFSNPALGKNVECRLTDSEIAISSELGSGSQNWNLFKTWTESPDSFILIIYKAHFVALPKRSFANDEDVATFRSFLQQRYGTAKA